MRTMLDFIKKILFWPRIRRWLIIWEQKKIAKFCDKLIERYCKEGIVYNFSPKKTLKGKKIIWQYWGQGFEDCNIPPLVCKCLSSVYEFCSTDEYEIIRLSDENFSEYIDLPNNIVVKLKNIHKAFFSDLLRCCLLTVYGGCWLDATVLLTGKIPDKYWKQDFFMFQRDDAEPYKKYWEHAFAYYYGWGTNFKVKVLNSIFFCQKGNSFITDLRNLLLFVWSENENLPTYFFFQILFNELLSIKYKNFNCLLEGDCIPHYLQQIINDDTFNIASFEDTLKLTTIHKLTYKIKQDSYERLVKLLERDKLDK